jgi:acyl-CoA thioester hydrolase
VSTAQYRVLYVDTDQMGVVNNVNYLRLFELGRAEWIRGRGRPYKAIEADGSQLPVVEAFLKYREPARYDDLLDIDVSIHDVRAASLVFRYQIRRAPDGAVLCEGHTKHACIGRDGKLKRFDTQLLHLLRADPDQTKE